MEIKIDSVEYSERFYNESLNDELMIRFKDIVEFNDPNGNPRITKGILFLSNTSEDTNHMIERAITDKLTDEEYGDLVVSWFNVPNFYMYPQKPWDGNVVYLKELDDELRLEIINKCRNAIKDKFK